MRASELIQDLVSQIAQHGDLPIQVMVDGAYHGAIDLEAMIKPDPYRDEHSFITIHASGDFYGKEGGEGGFYFDEDEPKQSNEGFMIMPDGTRSDLDFHADCFDDVPFSEQQAGIADMRKNGHYSEDVIQSTYPDAYVAPTLEEKQPTLGDRK